MKRAQAAAAEVLDIENIRHRVAQLDQVHLRNDRKIQGTSSEFEKLRKPNSSGSSLSNLHDLILLNIYKLKYSTRLLLNIDDTSRDIASTLFDCEQLQLKLLNRETPLLTMSNSPVVNITPTRSVVVGNAALNDLKSGELLRKMGPPVSSGRAPSGVSGSSVQAPSGMARGWRSKQLPTGQSLRDESTDPQSPRDESTDSQSDTGWVGGSKTTQVGGRDAYPLPINSKLYVDAVTQVNPLTPENNPEFYKKLEKAILDETIQPEPVTISSSGSYHPTSQKPTQKTVKGRAGDKGGNKVTTRKHHHRHPTIHNVGHTVKVAHKPTDVNTIKTRRNHHAVKT